MIETNVAFIRSLVPEFPERADGPLNRLAGLKLRGKAAYHVTKLCRLVTQELNHSEEVRVKLVREVGETDKDGNVTVPGDKIAEFQQQLKEAYETPVKLDWNPITLDMIGENEISAADLIALGPLFVESIEPQPEKEGA